METLAVQGRVRELMEVVATLSGHHLRRHFTTAPWALRSQWPLITRLIALPWRSSDNQILCVPFVKTATAAFGQRETLFICCPRALAQTFIIMSS